MADGNNQNNPDAGAPPAPAGGDGAPPAPVTSVSFEDLQKGGLPKSFFGEEGAGPLNTEALVAALSEGASLKTQAEERVKNTPKDGKYDFKLPTTFEKPGDGFEWNPDEGFAGAVGQWAQTRGLTQADVSDLTQVYATHQAGQFKADLERRKGELQKLGANASGRFTAIENYAKANLKAEEASAIIRAASALGSADLIIALEGLINLANAGRGAQRVNGQQEQAVPEFDKMSGKDLHKFAIDQSKRR